jgi:hypothetical protein
MIPNGYLPGITMKGPKKKGCNYVGKWCELDLMALYKHTSKYNTMQKNLGGFFKGNE